MIPLKVANLAAFFTVVAAYSRLKEHHLPEWMVSTGGWMIALVFFIRTIGDFHWVGICKKKKGTLFAHWDTRLYSPLCLFIAILWVTLLMR